MKILVAGGSGFIGSYVADALTCQGHKVLIYDRQASKYISKEQKMIKGDILNQESVESAVKGCEVVYNFAGIADMNEARMNPLETIRTNVLGNTILLEAARKARVKRYIFASTLYVYSEAGSFYRSSKQSCELVIENYNRVYGLDYTILRYGSLYGPRANKSNWIYNILEQALANGKITRYGDGEEIREYVWVEDAAKLSVEVLSDEFKNKCVLITGNASVKIKDLLVMIKEIMNNKIKVEYLPVANGRGGSFEPELHYEITPYSFNPKLGIRLTGRTAVDMGQGIIYLLNEIHKRKAISGKTKTGR